MDMLKGRVPWNRQQRAFRQVGEDARHLVGLKPQKRGAQKRKGAISGYVSRRDTLLSLGMGGRGGARTCMWSALGMWSLRA